jgi:hypothetical protein
VPGCIKHTPKYSSSMRQVFSVPDRGIPRTSTVPRMGLSSHTGAVSNVRLRQAAGAISAILC